MTDMVFILGNPILCEFRTERYQALKCTQATDASSNNILGNRNEKKTCIFAKSIPLKGIFSNNIDVFSFVLNFIIKIYLAYSIHFPWCTAFC